MDASESMKELASNKALVDNDDSYEAEHFLGNR